MHHSVVVAHEVVCDVHEDFDALWLLILSDRVKLVLNLIIFFNSPVVIRHVCAWVNYFLVSVICEIIIIICLQMSLFSL